MFMKICEKRDVVENNSKISIVVLKNPQMFRNNVLIFSDRTGEKQGVHLIDIVKRSATTFGCEHWRRYSQE